MKFIEVHGDSMNPTLLHSQILVLFETTNIRRNDIIAYRFKGKMLIKRLIGFAGDIIVVQDDVVSCNGETLFQYDSMISQYYEWEIPSGNMIVLGDNPLNSLDSRRVGFLPVGNVVGRVVARIWPPKWFRR